MDKIPMTQAGFTSADNELKQLKSVDRPSVIKAIAEAREHGDLSENAEYHSARELQSHIEGRIKELEAIISLAQIIEVSKLSGNIKFGATVQLVDEDTDAERTLQIVGEHEASTAPRRCSETSTTRMVFSSSPWRTLRVSPTSIILLGLHF